jgi:hypothetical protein
MGRAGLLLVASGLACSCKPAAATQQLTSTPKAPQKAETTAEDLQAAKNVMPLSEVITELTSGTRSATVLEHVKQRHIATLCVAGDELRFAANGADRQLLAALKDQKNLLTPAQESAYMQIVSKTQAEAARAKQAAGTARRAH